MNVSEKFAVQATLHALGLGRAGTVPPAQLIAAEGIDLVALARSVPQASMEDILTEVLGSLTVSTFAAIWEGKTEILRGLRRIKGSYPELLTERFSDLEIGAVALSSFEYLMILSEEASDLAVKAAMVMDAPSMRLELLQAGEGVDAHQLLLSGLNATEEQAMILGAFLRDPRGTLPLHSMAFALSQPVWPMLFLTLVGDENLDVALAALEASTSLQSLV